MKDYRVEIKARNNRILTLISDAGFDSIPKFARHYGLTYGTIAAFVSGKKPAYRSDGHGWVPSALALARALHVTPEVLFTDRQAQGGIKKAIREVDEADLAPLLSHYTDNETPESLLIEREEQEDFENILDDLPKREAETIRKRFGIGCDPQTLHEISRGFGLDGSDVVQQTVRLVESRALRRLKSPPFAKRLKAIGITVPTKPKKRDQP